MSELRPRTELERLMALAASGDISKEELLVGLRSSEVVVLIPAVETPAADALNPMVVQNGENWFVALFTHADSVPSHFAAERSAVAVPADLILRGLSPDAGIVVNPGSAGGFEVPARAISAFLASSSTERYFVRQQVRDGQLVPYALLRRSAQGDQVLKDVNDWRPDRQGSVDRAIRFPHDGDLEEVSAERAAEFISMVAERDYRPFAR